MSAHPPNPFAGMNPAHTAELDKWFHDVAVIAYPSPRGEAAMIDETEIKTLKYVRPYSIRRTQQRYVMPRATHVEPDPTRIFDPTRAVDLSSRLQPDGTVQWDIPDGDWTVMRFVARGTGQTTRPAPQAGHGFESNKFDHESYRRH